MTTVFGERLVGFVVVTFLKVFMYGPCILFIVLWSLLF